MALHTDRLPLRALSLAPSRAPLGARARARRWQDKEPATRGDPPGASGQHTSRFRVRRRPEGARRNRKRAWCWRRGHMHFSPAARPLRRQAARNGQSRAKRDATERSVSTRTVNGVSREQAGGGMHRAGRAERTYQRKQPRWPVEQTTPRKRGSRGGTTSERRSSLSDGPS